MPTESLSRRVLHSGGVRGADLAWQQEAETYQVPTRAYRPFDDPAPDNPCSVVLDQAQLLEADPLLAQAGRLMGVDLEGMPSRERNYIRKNYFQVAPVEAVFAVARITRCTGASERTAESIAGGTAWAYHMAVLQGKQVFVFDDEEGCCDCTRRWHYYDYGTGCLVPLQDVPTLPPSGGFAGIGTRDLSAAGRDAIREVFCNTIRGWNPT